MNTPYVKLHPHAKAPTRARDTDAGSDLCSIEERILMPGERHAFGTGIAVAIPIGLYGRVAPRSGLAVKHGIDVLAGVVDASYRGELKVALINLGQVPYTVMVGDKIAQLVIECCASPKWEEVTSLDDTDRGAKGFGSSGQ
jgi:dUTP diphosphatase